MIDVDRLRLSLPAGYAGRADSIARLVASELETRLAGAAGALDGLQVGPVEITPGANDRAVAQTIAAAITDRTHSALKGS